MRERVINNTLQPEMLDSGQQLAASGTAGSVREDVRLSENDRARLVATGKVTVVSIEETPAPDSDAAPEEPATAAPRPRAPRNAAR